MKVAVITTRSAVVEVHAHNCADVAKSAKRNMDDPWILDVDTLVELSESYWGDVISDTVDPDSDEGKALARQYASTEFKVLPCAKDLPFADEDTTEEATPVATEVTTWVGKAIAAKLLSDGARIGFVAKLADAKPTKAGDRTVKLTAHEAEELRMACSNLEELGGSLAYSARTLRARLS